MVDRHDQVSIKRQAQLLGMSRGSVYYLPTPISDADLTLMRRIDYLHLEHPSMSARMLRESAAQPGDHPDQPCLGAGHDVHPDGAAVVYPTAVVDVASRRVLSHKLTITLEAVHAEEVIEQAVA